MRAGSRAAGTNPRARGTSPRQRGTNPRQMGTNTLAGTDAGAEHAATQRAVAVLVLSHCGLTWCEACSDALWVVEPDPDRPGRAVSRRCGECRRMPVGIAERIARFRHLLTGPPVLGDSPYYGALVALAGGLAVEVGAFEP